MPEYGSKTTKSKADILKRAKAAFKYATEVEAKQRRREREDLEFQIPELQWDAEAVAARQGGTVGNQVVPPRPMLSISLLAQPLQLIQNQAQSAQLGVEIHPVSEKSNKELAEVKQGLYRRIERDSNAEQARLWGFDRAKQCGRGWYRVNTQWDEDGDDPFDQEIVIERIFDGSNVYMDPAAQKPDFSDARWGMIVCYVPADDIKEQYPSATVPQTQDEFKSWEKEDPEWVAMAGESKTILVAEFFYKNTTYSTITVNGRERKKPVDTVTYCKVTAKDVLEEQPWNGKYIPLIPVIGKELQPFDEEHRWEGLIRPARGGQKFANYAASSVVEAMSLEPKVPWVGAEGQFEGHEEEYELSNIRNLSRLEYKPTSLDGTPLPPPARAQVDGSRMQLSMAAFSQAKDIVQTGTAVHEPSLGELPSRRDAQSGRAILALQQQSDAGTGHYLQNLAKISMAYEAKVVLDLMPAIYDRPGRITQILGEDNKERTVMLNKPFIPGQNGGPPQAYVPPKPPMGAPGQPMLPSEVKQYNLREGKYSISVSVGKSFQTRLQEGQAEIGQILQAQPQLMPMIGDLYFEYRDFPGHKEIADRLAKVREKQLPGLTEEEGQEPSPEQLKSQIQQMGEQLEQVSQQLQMAVQKLETEQAKQQAVIQKAQMDNETRLRIAQIQAEGKETEAQLQATIEELKAKVKMLSEAAQRGHETEENELDREHEATMEVAKAAMRPPDMKYMGPMKEPLESEGGEA